MAKQKPVSPDSVSEIAQLKPEHQLIIKGKDAGFTNRQIGRMIGYHPVAVSQIYTKKLKKFSLLAQKRIKQAIKAHDLIVAKYLEDPEHERINFPALTRAIDRVLDRVHPVQSVQPATTISFTEITVNQEAVNNPAPMHIVTQLEQPVTDGGQSVGERG
jgi:hypothetical protein